MNFKLLIIIFIILAAIAAIWSIFIEPNKLIVRKITLPLNNWPEEYDNLRVAVMADIHTGSPFNDIKRLDKIVEAVNKEKPDLVLNLGDYVIKGVLGGKVVEIEEIAGHLKNIKAPLGTISVLGNHDWWYDGKRVRRALEETGVTVLDNQVTRVTYNNKAFWVAGLSDYNTGHPSVKKTLEQVKDDNPIILLTHHPDMFKMVPQKVSLTLAGHVHAGQLNLPFIGGPGLPSKHGQKYRYGLVKENNKVMYVSSGIGTSILPVRFNAVPEVVIFTLKSK